MLKDVLQKMIDDGLSTYEMANKISTSQTNVRYWLKKHGIKTKLSDRSDDGKCMTCGVFLTQKKRKFCCNACKCKYNNFNSNDGRGHQIYQHQKARGNERKKLFVEKLGGSCMICGYNKSLRALTFHHRNIDSKSFTLDTRNLSNRTYEKCVDELEKCDLLCFNCHMELHEREELNKTIVVPAGFEPATLQL